MFYVSKSFSGMSSHKHKHNITRQKLCVYVLCYVYDKNISVKTHCCMSQFRSNVSRQATGMRNNEKENGPSHGAQKIRKLAFTLHHHTTTSQCLLNRSFAISSHYSPLFGTCCPQPAPTVAFSLQQRPPSSWHSPTCLFGCSTNPWNDKPPTPIVTIHHYHYHVGVYCHHHNYIGFIVGRRLGLGGCHQ